MKLPRTLIKILLAASVLLLAGYTVVKSPKLTHGFASYYTHSKILISGGDMTAAYDTAYFHSKMKEYGLGGIKDLANLPTGSFIFLPLTPFEPVTAKIIWCALSIIFLLLSIYILLLTLDIPPKSTQALMLMIAVFLFFPLYYNIALGQVYTFLLLLASIAVYGFKREKLILIAIPLSLLILLKGYGAFPLLALLLTRRFKPFLVTSGIVLLVFFATLPLFGLSAWQMYYREFLSIVAFGRDASNVAYQSLNSFFGHLLVYHPDKNPYALLNTSQVYVYYFVQFIGLITLYLISRKLSKENSLIVFTVSFAMNVLVSPSGEDYHSLLYLPLIYFTGKYIFENQLKFNFPTVGFAIAVILLATPIPFRLLQLADFPLYLFAYPRLYGAILLIILSMNTGFLTNQTPVINQDTARL